jgi:simple sugar transport system ATP-binding protein
VTAVPPLLEMRGITKRFGDTLALDGVDFAVERAEIHALLGENGAGKSTLMHLLSGLYHLTAGEIRVDGRLVRLKSPRDAASLGIRMVHQHFTLVERFTVAENLALFAPRSSHGSRVAAGAHGVGRESHENRSDARLSAHSVGARREPRPPWFDPGRAAGPGLDLARRLGWPLPADVPVERLPVGVQQRVEIVKALQAEARLLIVDEPTAVLAPPEVEELFDVLEKLRAEGCAIVFISHKLGEVMRLCDRVTVLRRGRYAGTVAVSETTATDLARRMIGEAPEAGALQHDAAERDGSDMRTRKREGSENAKASPEPDPGAGLVLRDFTVPIGKGRSAVRELTLAVSPGQVFGLAGVDGNGQMELAEALFGLRPATATEATLGGRSLLGAAGEGTRRTVGLIPADRRRTGLILEMTVRDNLVLDRHDETEFRWGPFLRLGRLARHAARLAERFDIRVASPLTAAAALSGGNQQKIVIARALSREPALLIAVNPTRGLDVGATEFVHSQLLAQRDQGAAILLISTELDEVLALSDRFGVLYEGRLVGVGSPSTPRETIGLWMGGKTAEAAAAR